jgi:glycosyltransferase involved in cell wall biosynthesis
MDIFVFPSLKEGLGLSLLEAMASGRPCVASRVGGISDVIRDGETGLLFSVGDSKGLAACILRLLDDRALMGRLGQSAGTFARERFSSAVMAEKVLEVYNEVADSYAKSN